MSMTTERKLWGRKGIIFVLIMLVSVCGLYAQNKNLRIGGTYVLKAADGSGQVGLYPPSSFEPWEDIPDGTEVILTKQENMQSFNTHYQQVGIKYNGKDYYVKAVDIGAETAASKAAGAKAKAAGVGRMISGIILWVLIIAGFITLGKRNKKEARAIYLAYYTEKRREFPWLEEWFKTYDPVNKRAGTAALLGNIVSIVSFIILCYLLAFIIGKIFPAVNTSFILNTLTAFIAIPVAFFLASKIGKLLLKNPGSGSASGDYHVDLECPSCHCPHAWTRVFYQGILEGSTKTTTTKTEWGQHGAMDVVTGTTSKKTTSTSEVTYDVHEIRDFKCENCGHTEHKEDDTTSSIPPSGEPDLEVVRTWEDAWLVSEQPEEASESSAEGWKQKLDKTLKELQNTFKGRQKR